MRKHVLEFIRRGMMAAWMGPLVMAVIYGSLGAGGAMESLAVREVCLGIVSSIVLAFIAAGSPVVYQVEQLPLPMAILIHCGVLYLDYLLVYLINGWLQNDLVPILVFTGVFVAGFALIWLVIYQFIKKDIKKLNQKIQPQ